MSKLKTNLVVSCQSFFSSVGLCAADDLAAVDRVVGVDPRVPLEVLLPGEGLVAVRTIVNPLHLFAAGVSLPLSVGEIALLHTSLIRGGFHDTLSFKRFLYKQFMENKDAGTRKCKIRGQKKSYSRAYLGVLLNLLGLLGAGV